MGCILSKNKINHTDNCIDIDSFWYSYDECCVCLDNNCNIVLLPCNHFVLCGSCAQNIYNTTNKCPICQTPISNYSYLKLSIII